MDVPSATRSTLSREDVVNGVPNRVNTMSIVGMILLLVEIVNVYFVVIELNGLIFISITAWLIWFGIYAGLVAIWSLIVLYTNTQLKRTHAHHDYKLQAHYQSVAFKAFLGLALIWGFYGQYHDTVLAGTGDVLDDFRDESLDGPLYLNTSEYATLLGRALSKWYVIQAFILISTFSVIYTGGEASVAHVIVDTIPHDVDKAFSSTRRRKKGSY